MTLRYCQLSFLQGVTIFSPPTPVFALHRTKLNKRLEPIFAGQVPQDQRRRRPDGWRGLDLHRQPLLSGRPRGLGPRLGGPPFHGRLVVQHPVVAAILPRQPPLQRVPPDHRGHRLHARLHPVERDLLPRRLVRRPRSPARDQERTAPGRQEGPNH